MLFGMKPNRVESGRCVGPAVTGAKPEQPISSSFGMLTQPLDLLAAVHADVVSGDEGLLLSAHRNHRMCEIVVKLRWGAHDLSEGEGGRGWVGSLCMKRDRKEKHGRCKKRQRRTRGELPSSITYLHL